MNYLHGFHAVAATLMLVAFAVAGVVAVIVVFSISERLLEVHAIYCFLYWVTLICLIIFLIGASW